MSRTHRSAVHRSAARRRTAFPRTAFRCAAAVPLLIGVFAVAACSGHATSGSTAPANGQGTASQSGSAPASSPTLTPAGTETGNANGIDRCHTAQLRGQVEVSQQGGAGQRFALLGLTNTGAACRMYGYPGMAARDAQQRSMPTAVLRAPSPAPTTFVLDPGATAWSQLHWTVVPAADESGTQCQPNTESLWVTPPDETSQLSVPAALGAVCQHNQINVTAMSPSRPSL